MISTPRLLVVALDGADPGVIYANLNRLPRLAEVCARGCHGRIDSLIHSLDIWTSYYTGLPPERHGVIYRRLATAGGAASLGEVRTDLFIWDWLNLHGLSTGFIEPLAAYPAPRVNGFFLSGKPRPSLAENPAGFYPPELFELLGPENWADIQAPPSLADLGLTEPFAQIPVAQLLRHLDRGYFRDYPRRTRPVLKRCTDLALRLYERRPVDVVWVYFMDADIIGHFGWHEGTRRLILPTYVELDRVLGRLIDALAPDAVVALSDHGMLPLAALLAEDQEEPLLSELAAEYRRDGTRLLRPDLAVIEGFNHGLCSGTHYKWGFYAIRGRDIKRAGRNDLHYLDIFPMLLRAAGLPAPPGREGRVPGIFE